MKTLELSTELNASPDAVWDAVRQPKLLQHVAKGVLSFKPVNPPVFPAYWEAGEYEAAMFWKGFLPIGRQIIGVEFPEPQDGVRFVRDNGRSRMIKVWDHLIAIAPAPDGRTLYTDTLRLDAGALTPFVALFADRFYRHRQRRWRALADNGFKFPEETP